jgi:hypothetical protein
VLLSILPRAIQQQTSSTDHADIFFSGWEGASEAGPCYQPAVSDLQPSP